MEWITSPERNDDIVVSQLESLVLSVDYANRKWHAPRGKPHLLNTIPSPMPFSDIGDYGTILSIDIASSRWLVVVYQESMLALWDLHSSTGDDHPQVGFNWPATETNAPTRIFKGMLDGMGLCASSVVCMDSDGDSILLAASR